MSLNRPDDSSVLAWLSRYRREDIGGDLLAGVTTAAMLIPQSMGYAMLAGLPPQMGLYAACVPLLAYGLLGGSRQLAVGPVALDSLLTAVTIGALAVSGSDAYIAYAILLAGMVGILQIGLGALGLGFLVNFLSRPVISGFTSAAALIIGLSQLQHLLGLPLPPAIDVHRVVMQAVLEIERWHVPTLVLGLGSLALLVGLRRRYPRVPHALVVVAVGTLAAWSLNLAEHGVTIVDHVPAGLPPLTLPHIDGAAMLQLAPGALTIALVGFMEAISIAKHYARSGRYEIEPGRELVALGTANLSGSLFSAYPVAGGFSRTAINAGAGAATPLAGILTGVTVGAALLVLTPLFHYMPHAILAAIILHAISGLVDLREPRRLWRVKRSDFWVLASTFAATLLVGIQYGVLGGVALSLIVFLVRTTRPHMVVLGRIQGTETYVSTRRDPHITTYPGMLIVRIDSQIYFGNVSFLRKMLRDMEQEIHAPLHTLILDASGINQLDSSAEAALQELDQDYRERGVKLMFAGVKGPVRDVLGRSGMLRRLIREQRIFTRIHEAVTHALGTQEASDR